MNSTGQFMVSTNRGIAGVPRTTTPWKASSYISLVAEDTTRAHNSVRPSVPAKAIFFIRWSFQWREFLNLFSLSNSRCQGQTYFLTAGFWLLVTGSFWMSLNFFASRQLPEASNQKGVLILFDKFAKNDINDQFVIKRIDQVFGVSCLVFSLAIDIFAIPRTTKH